MSDLQNRNDQVVSLGDWLVTLLISSLPIFGFIMLLVWAFGGGAKESKRNFARATLIFSLIVGVIGVVVAIIFGTAIVGLFATNYSSYYSSFG